MCIGLARSKLMPLSTISVILVQEATPTVVKYYQAHFAALRKKNEISQKEGR